MGLTIPDYDDPRAAAAYGKRPATTRAELRALSRLLARVPRGGTILDLPCGNGRLAPFLRSLRPERLVGVDGAPAMLREAAAAYDVVACGDAASLPLRDRAADLVVCLRLLHHFPAAADRARILRELRRVARGAVVLSHYDPRTLEGLRRRLGGRSARSGLPRRRLARELGSAGLRPLRFLSLFRLVREQTLVLAAPRE